MELKFYDDDDGMSVMTNKREYQKGVSSRLRGQWCWKCGTH